MLKFGIKEVLYTRALITKLKPYLWKNHLNLGRDAQIELVNEVTEFGLNAKIPNYLMWKKSCFISKQENLTQINKNRISINDIFGIFFDESDETWAERNFIKVGLVQKNKKNHFLQLYNENNDTVRFWSKKRLTNSFIFYIFQSLFICAYFAVTTTNIFLQYTANHKLYLHSFNKGITPYMKTIYNLNLRFNFNIIITKPNFFYLNFQKKKFGSIKKSRKKLMYRFLPLYHPKLPKMFNLSVYLLILINFVVVTLIFWLLTLVELMLNKNTDNEIKNDVYECGFNTINKTTFPVTLNTIILLLFVIIYEVEFIILTPFLLNLTVSIGNLTYYFSFLFLTIIITLYLDIWLKKIFWVY